MRAVRWIVPAALVLASVGSAYAQPPPMTFRAVGWCDDSNLLFKPNPNRPLALCPPDRVRYAIFAAGRIASDSAEEFARVLAAARPGRLGPGTDLYLNSGGGHLVGGMRLGRAVRAAGFSTRVGAWAPGGAEGLVSRPVAIPGACISACTLVFLGGTERFFGAGIYGVHRFYIPPPPPGAAPSPHDPHLVDEAQLLTSAVLAYVREMGVDPGFVNEMLKTGRERGEGPDAHQRFAQLSPGRMAELNVVTASSARWAALEDPKSGNWLVRGEWLRPAAFKTIEFACLAAAGGKREVAVRARGTLRALAKNPNTLLRVLVNVIAYDGTSPSGNRAALTIREVISVPRVTEGVAEVAFRITRPVAEMLQNATRIVVEFDLPTPPEQFRIRRAETYQIDMDFANGRGLTRALIANCR